MKMIVGLGNPGAAYAGTRHNAGFMLVDRLAGLFDAGGEKKRGKALIRVAEAEGGRVLLTKPQAFMNRSGDPLWELLLFYKDIKDFIVVHDDLDMPLGRLRFKSGGGAGGHRGLQSITSRLGSDAYDRLKIGISRPPDQIPADAYVLRDFSADEKPVLEKVLDLGAEGIRYWLTRGCLDAMNKYNAADLRTDNDK